MQTHLQLHILRVALHSNTYNNSGPPVSRTFQGWPTIETHNTSVAHHWNADFKGDLPLKRYLKGGPPFKRTFKVHLPLRRIFSWWTSIETHIWSLAHHSNPQFKGGPPFRPTAIHSQRFQTYILRSPNIQTHIGMVIHLSNTHLKVAHHSNAHYKSGPQFKRKLEGLQHSNAHYKDGPQFKSTVEGWPTIHAHIFRVHHHHWNAYLKVAHQIKCTFKAWRAQHWKTHFIGGPPLKRTFLRLSIIETNIWTLPYHSN